MSKSYAIHPIAEVFPEMADHDYEALRAGMERDGFDASFPIWVYEDQILDGRHRYRACKELGIAPSFEEYKGSDPLGFVTRGNLARRHLDESQRAMVAARIATLPQGARTDLAQICAKSQDDAAELLGVARRTVQHARKVIENGAAVLVRAVERGEMAVSVAAKLAVLPERDQMEILSIDEKAEQRKAIRAAEAKSRERKDKAADSELILTAETGRGKRAAFSVEEWQKLKASEREAIIAAGYEAKHERMNEQTGTSIEWARWSHNTVTGCLHNCPYCYARDIAERMYPQKFAPTFHPSRLAGPASIEVPAEAKRDTSYRNIFANSMSDLFGQWVPQDWIEATIEMARRNQKWNFLTLTKFPQRAADFEFPDNWWMGTTVDAQSRVANAERAFERIRAKTKWLSIEPLLEPLTFKRLDLFQWVVIGGSSRSTKTPEWHPPFDWVARLHLAARDAGCRIYHKTNIGAMDEWRVREFPWQKPKDAELPAAFRYLKGM